MQEHPLVFLSQSFTKPRDLWKWLMVAKGGIKFLLSLSDLVLVSLSFE